MVLDGVAEAWAERREEIRAPGRADGRGAERHRAARALGRADHATSCCATALVVAVERATTAANGGFGRRAEVPAGLA